MTETITVLVLRRSRVWLHLHLLPTRTACLARNARYYASLPRNQRPLFDENYDDSFLWRKGQLQAMINRLARMEQLTLEERLVNGYTALPYEPGTRTKVRYIDTQACLHDRDAWINDAQEGTVLVTPGVSPGELAIKNIAIECRLPLIHLQKEPITKRPEGERFFACAEGSLLILAPWPEDLDAMPRPPQSPCLGGGTKPGQASLPPKQGERGGLVSDYDRFHNMNLLAKQICEMDTINLPLSFRVIR